MQNVLLSSAYLGPIEYYYHLLNHNCKIEQHEHYIKQTYRNRCEIYSPQGILNLTIPLVKRSMRQSMKDVRISYEYNWQSLHWRSLQSCYRRSAFFEYFEDDLRIFYETPKTDFLIELNELLQQLILELLQTKINYSFTTEYVATPINTIDLRKAITPKSAHTHTQLSTTPYFQVFENKHGFIPNLSILDLLFSQGTRAKDFLIA
jgi:WbqC-like protein family